jgi:acyl carrier protein
MAIQGFDSLCGIEVTGDLQARLGLKLEDNIFVKANGTRAAARTLAEVVDALLKAAR